MHRSDFRLGAYQLVPIRFADREAIRQWRNAQLDVLRQSAPLTAAQQDRYFEQVVAPLFEQPQPEQLLFSFLLNEELIGYGGLVHIDWEAGRAEISFLLETTRNANITAFQTDFRAYLNLLREVAFTELPLQKINTEAYDVRPYLTEVLEQEGFAEEARLPRHVRVEGQVVATIFHACYRPAMSAFGNLLATSIGAKVPLLYALRAAARQASYSTQLFGGDLDSECLGQYFTDEFWPLPPLTEEQLPTLLAGCRARGITRIIPTRDGELAFWSRHRAMLESEGIAVLVSAPAAVARCLDKLAFAEFGRARELPVIPTTLSLDELPGTAFVVKERHGAGSEHLGLNLTRAEALAHAATLREPIFQPFVAGRELSADAYVDRTGRVHGLVARTRDVVVRGESQITTTLPDPALTARLVAIVGELGLYGPLVLQALLDARGELHLIECNCRFGGASTLGIAAGVDSFAWFLREAAGADLADFPFVPAAGPLRQIRAAHDVVRPVTD